jgi:hypothetical protein
MIDPSSAMPLAAHNVARFNENIGNLVAGTMPPEQLDKESVGYWRMEAEELAAQVVYAIDQPLGVTISDITVRATGEDYVY